MCVFTQRIQTVDLVAQEESHLTLTMLLVAGYNTGQLEAFAVVMYS